MNSNVIKITDFICNSKMESKVKLIIEWNNIWKTKIIKKKTNFQKSIFKKSNHHPMCSYCWQEIWTYIIILTTSSAEVSNKPIEVSTLLTRIQSSDLMHPLTMILKLTQPKLTHSKRKKDT
jgi:hypothetical protein